MQRGSLDPERDVVSPGGLGAMRSLKIESFLYLFLFFLDSIISECQEAVGKDWKQPYSRPKSVSIKRQVQEPHPLASPSVLELEPDSQRKIIKC